MVLLEYYPRFIQLSEQLTVELEDEEDAEDGEEEDILGKIDLFTDEPVAE